MKNTGKGKVEFYNWFIKMQSLRINHFRALTIAVLILCVPLIANAQNKKWKMYGHTFPEAGAKFSISVIPDRRSRGKLGVGWKRAINPSFILTRYRDWYKDSVFLKVNLDSIAAKLIKAKVKEPLDFRSNVKTNKNILTVRSIAFINPDLSDSLYHTLNQYALSFQVEAIYSDAQGAETWKAQYFYTVPDNRPLFGKESLTANDGELLRQWTEQGLDKCIEVLFTDLKGANAMWKNDPLPEELKLPKGSWAQWPEGTVLLQETNEDWVLRQPIILFKHTGGFVTMINSKNKNRLLPHPIGK